MHFVMAVTQYTALPELVSVARPLSRQCCLSSSVLWCWSGWSTDRRFTDMVVRNRLPADEREMGVCMVLGEDLPPELVTWYCGSVAFAGSGFAWFDGVDASFVRVVADQQGLWDVPTTVPDGDGRAVACVSTEWNKGK